MNTYRITLGKNAEHRITIKCANEVDACWQAYEIARRFNKPLHNVELT